MLNYLGKTVLAVAAVCSVGSARAAVLTFDDLPGLGPSFFQSNYNGFKFGTNLLATTAWFYTAEVSTFYSPKSGTKFVATDDSLYDPTNLFEATQSISNTTAFTFDGAWFSGAGLTGPGDQVRYELYLGGILQHTSANSSPLAFAPIFVASGYAGFVDSVVIVGRQGFYAMDDFTYNSRLNVPEPATYGLVAVALLAAGVARRRRTR